MMLKLVLSSELNVPFFPSIHNIGMCNETVEAFGEYTGKDFAYGEYLFLMRNIARKLYDFNDEKVKGIESALSKKPTIDQIKKTIDLYKKEFGSDYSDDPFDQLVFIMKKAL